MRYALMICRDENAWPGVPAVPAPEASSLAAGGACGVIGERPIPMTNGATFVVKLEGWRWPSHFQGT